MFHDIVRKIYYLTNNFRIKLFKRHVKVFWSTCIKQPKLIESYCKIGKRTYLNGKIGSCSYIGEDCRINANIGKFCSIGNNVKTIEANHPYSFVSTSPVFYSRKKQCLVTFADKDYYNESTINNTTTKTSCTIGNDVWIGENVLIKGGVTIGDGACIAMGAVVTHDVEPYSIVAGIPARVIKMRFTEKEISIIRNSKWWNKDLAFLADNVELFRNVDEFVRKMR